MSVERDRTLRRGAGAGLLYRVVSVLVPLLLVPIGLSHLGEDGFAIWMVATGLTSVFVFADLGLGNTVMSRLGALQATPEGHASAARLVTSAAVALCGISALLLGAVALFVGSGAWSRLLSVPESVTGGALTVGVIAVSMALNIPASLVHRVLFGLQKVDVSYYWQTAGPVLSLALGVALPAVFSDPSFFVVGVAAGPLVANLVCTFVALKSWQGADPPKLSVPTLRELRELVTTSGAFVVIAVLMAVSTSADVLLLPHFVPLAEVAEFSVAWRVFSQVGLVLALLSVPLWPTAADALAHGDRLWLVKAIKKIQFANLTVMAVVALGAWLLGPWAVDVWLGGRVAVSPVLLVGFALWWVLQGLAYPYFMVQNAGLRIGWQTLAWLTFAVLSLSLKAWALTSGVGVEWLMWITCAVYAVTLLPCALWVTGRIVRDLSPPPAGAAAPSSVGHR